MIADDTSVCRPIKESMEHDYTDVCCMNSPAEALDSFMKQEYCLVIMDFQLPKMDGLEMARIMREAKHTPIMAITSRLNSTEKVKIFQAGANAYIEKPMDISVCVAQSMTLIKLYEDSGNVTKKRHPLTFGTELVVSPLYRQVIVDGVPLELTKTEFDLFFCLAQHQGQVWSRSQLYRHVWDDALGEEGENTVRAHIGNLRKKLAEVGKEYIQTARGVGYKFVPSDNK